MLQRLFIHANVEAELHEHNSVMQDHHDDLTNSHNNDKTKSKHSGSKVVIIAATLYFIWIWVGIIFYKYYSNWTLGTAYYYAMEAGLSIGFCEPSEVDDWSRLFTIFYVLSASSLVSGSIGAVTSKLLSTRAVLIPTRNRVVLFVDSTTKRMTVISVCTKLWYELKVCVGWYSHRSRVISFIIFIIWMGIGTVYGMMIERWTFITSLYWAVTSCSTGGLQSAVCLAGTSGATCDIGNLRGGLMGTYFLFGVPIYANCLGQFAMMAIQRAVLEDRMNKLKQPIDDNEFMYCANILSPAGSDTLNCGEYILLELMRLRACNANQIESLKANFNRIDTHQTGFITMEELRQVGKVVAPKYRTAVGKVRTMSIEFIDNFIASPSMKLFQFGSQPSEGGAEADDADDRDRDLVMKQQQQQQQQEVDEEVMMRSNEWATTNSHTSSIKSTMALKDYPTTMNNTNSPREDYHNQLSVLDDDDEEMEEKSTSQ